MTRVYLAAYRDGMSTRYQEVGPEDMGAEAFVPEGAVVRVKPLIWDGSIEDCYLSATALDGFYEIGVEHEDEWYCDFTSHDDGKRLRIATYKDGPEIPFDVAQAHHEARIRAALGLTTEPEPTSGWQPIETAPKDGTQFLAVCAVDCGSRNYWIVRWEPDGNAEWGGGGSFVCGSDAEGLTEIKDDVCVSCLSHWKPLDLPESHDGGTPTSGAYEMICLTAEDVVRGRGFTGDPAADLATAQESLRVCLALLGWRG